ncbi:MAG: LTA synthase family protein [Pseudomonadota bacterium]
MLASLFSFPKSRFSPLFLIYLVAVTCFTLLRMALILKEWPLIGHTIASFLYIFGMGLVYDTALLSYFAIPFVFLFLLLPNKWFRSRIFKAGVQIGVFVILNALLFSLVAEWLFWDEFSVRFNFIAVDYLVYRREVTDNIIQSYPLPAILGGIFFLSTLLFLTIRKKFLTSMEYSEIPFKRLATAGILLLLPVLSFLYLHQGQNNRSNNNYTNELASNGAYQLFAAFRNNSLDYRTFYALGNDRELSEKLRTEVIETNSSFTENKLYDITRQIDPKQPEQKLNVILISVESLSAEYLSRFGNKDNITPFLDKLFQEGMLFTDFYATGTRTVRGLEAITLSLPPTPGGSVVKRPDNDHMYSLGKVFADHGYDTAFLYGGRGYFDNMNSFFSGNGYRTIDQTDLAKNEITFENAWGVADENLYGRALSEADRDHAAGKPFFFHIMTTSNHRPYTYPDGKIDISSGTGRAGAVKYTDYALSRLVEEAKSRPWFDNTVFVIVADHCAGSAGKVGLPIDKYHIPFFIYSPGHVTPREITTLASQIDIAPTLLSLLHFSYRSFFFGRDILTPDFQPRALIGNYQKLGFLKENKLLILSPRQEIDVVTDGGAGNPVISKVEESDPFVQDLMSFYQGADYVLRKRLNRWQKNNNDKG